jgi:hypothetical protein
VRREKENTSFDQMENEKFPENKEFSKTHTTKTLAQSNQTKPIQDFFLLWRGAPPHSADRAAAAYPEEHSRGEKSTRIEW